MNRKQTGPIPEAIAQLQRQFDQFRSTQPRRTKLPESLWQAAVELAREHGVYPVGTRYGWTYVGLKKPLNSKMFTAVAYAPATEALYLRFRSGEIYGYFDGQTQAVN